MITVLGIGDTIDGLSSSSTGATMCIGIITGDTLPMFTGAGTTAKFFPGGEHERRCNTSARPLILAPFPNRVLDCLLRDCMPFRGSALFGAPRRLMKAAARSTIKCARFAAPKNGEEKGKLEDNARGEVRR